jgi:hypothetical protein
MRRTHVILSILFAMLPQLAAAQNEILAAATGISMSVTADQKSIKRGESIRLIYSIRNTGSRAIYVPRGVWDEITCPKAPHFWAGLIDSSGKRFEPGFAGSCLGPKPENITDRLKEYSVLLRPGDVYHDAFTLETAMFRNVLMPGTYRVECLFFGWRDDQFTTAEKLELRKLGHPLLGGVLKKSTTIEVTF